MKSWFLFVDSSSSKIFSKLQKGLFVRGPWTYFSLYRNLLDCVYVILNKSQISIISPICCQVENGSCSWVGRYTYPVHLYQYMYSVITPFRLAVQPHPLALFVLIFSMSCTLYSLTLLQHNHTRSLYSVQPHPLAEQHPPLSVSITSSMCSLTCPLNKLSAHNFTCPLSTVQPHLVEVSSLDCSLYSLFCSLFRFTTSQLTMYCICTASAAHCPAQGGRAQHDFSLAWLEATWYSSGSGHGTTRNIAGSSMVLQNVY